jgi:hypothetical protein
LESIGRDPQSYTPPRAYSIARKILRIKQQKSEQWPLRPKLQYTNSKETLQTVFSASQTILPDSSFGCSEACMSPATIPQPHAASSTLKCTLTYSFALIRVSLKVPRPTDRPFHTVGETPLRTNTNLTLARKKTSVLADRSRTVGIGAWGLAPPRAHHQAFPATLLRHDPVTNNVLDAWPNQRTTLAPQYPFKQRLCL